MQIAGKDETLFLSFSERSREKSATLTFDFWSDPTVDANSRGHRVGTRANGKWNYLEEQWENVCQDAARLCNANDNAGKNVSSAEED